MREQPDEQVPQRGEPRITPAHAGTTLVILGSRPTAKDHPRSCGNNYDSCNAAASFVGSPPLMREQPPVECHRTPLGGITPAHAGTTLKCAKHSKYYKDHPRSCGNN